MSNKLYALASGAPAGVDPKSKRINGFIVAETGPFREPNPRGSFNLQSLQRIVSLMNQQKDGTRVHLDHESIVKTNLLTFLGRAWNARLDGNKVRADLYFDLSAESLPGLGNVVDYLMKRVQSDAASLSSSLVLGGIEIDTNDRSPTPVWIPTAIESSDIVAKGAAVGSLLSPATTRIGRYVQRLDAMKTSARGMPRQLQLAESAYHKNRQRISEPLEIVGCVATYGHEFKAGWLDLWGNPSRHLLYRGCFQDIDNHVTLQLNHNGREYASTERGTLRLWSDDVGLWCWASVSDADIMDQLLSGSIVGMSPMLIPGDSQSSGGVTRHRRCGIDEVSLAHAPGNVMTIVAPVHGPVPDHVSRAVVLCRNRAEQCRSGIVRQLLRHRDAMTC